MKRQLQAILIILSALVIFGSVLVHAQKPSAKTQSKTKAEKTEKASAKTKSEKAEKERKPRLRTVVVGSGKQDGGGGIEVHVKATTLSRTPVHPELFKPQAGKAVRFGITRPLGSIEPIKVPMKPMEMGKGEEVENLEFPWTNLGMKLPHTPDAAVIGPGRAAPGPLALSGPTVSFEGLNSQETVDVNGGVVIPPDTNGDVGPNHYVETVNTPLRVFDKAGTPLTPPVQMSSLWETIGGVCADTDRGDPVVIYDPMADRWLISQFGFDVLGAVPFPPPTHQCVAISVTGDPTGAWYAYDFIMPGVKFHDYPHYGMWPDGYYMTANLFSPNGNFFMGTSAVVYDRVRMLAGDPDAGFIYFDLEHFDPNIGGTLPADMDGLNPPPAGAPGIISYFLADEFGDPFDGLRLFDFHADFDNPENSTFTERAESPVPTPSFNPLNPAGRGDIAQPPPAAGGSASRLDSIQDRIMHRLQYRNFGSHETLAVAHTVDVDPSGTYQAGVRYHELHSAGLGGAYSEFDAGSIALTTEHRWMGSAALDSAGNLAVGYSVSSLTTFPSIRYFGRRADGTIEGETTLIAGAGSQTAGNPGAPAGQRWGDYSSMSVDPVDDCSFWYAQEYYASSDTTPADYPFGRNWQTRIGKFRFPTQSCASASVGTLNGTITDASTFGAIFRARVLAVDTNGNSYEVGSTNAGVFSRVLPPGNYALTGTAPGYQDVGPIYITLAGGATVTQNFALQSMPSLDYAGNVVDDSAGNVNGVIDPDECINLNLDLANIGPASSTATGISAELESNTAGVTVSASTDTQTYPDITGGNNTTNSSPFQISVSPAFVCGTPVHMTLHVTSNEGNFTVPLTLPSGSPNVHVFSVSGPTAIPDGGGAGTPLNVTIPVAGITDVVTKVKLSVVLTTAQNNDIDMFLLNPLATSVEISTDNGSRGDNYGTGCPADDDDAVFDMNAATSILSTGSPLIGHYRPEGNLNTFNGVNPNGSWTLRISDDLLLNSGFPGENGLATFQCATLIIETQPSCTPGSGVCAEAIPVLAVDSTLVSGGNGDDNVDVHECFDLNVNLINDGTANSSGAPISALLSTTTTGVTIHQNASNYNSPLAPGAPEQNLTPFQIETSPDLPCGEDIDFTLDVQTTQGLMSIPFKLPVGAATVTSLSNTTPVPIPDNDLNGADSPISVSGLQGTISNITLSTFITHTWDGDIELQLVHPDGTVLNLSAHNGGSGDNYGNACPGNSIFSDAGALYHVQSVAPFVGTFKPEDLLSTLNGKDPNGTWNLHVFDSGGGDVGTIQCWSLNITTNECEDGMCCPVITVTPATLPDPYDGIAYSQTVSGSGGEAPYTFSVSSGTLPSGLSLNMSTGEISGTPDTPGAATFEITATDANGCTGATSYSMTVQTCPAITITPGTLSDGTTGVAYSADLDGSGGTAPYTFDVIGGALPDGLSLDQNTGVISGTPTVADTFNFTIGVTDDNGCQGDDGYTVTIVLACDFCDDFEGGPQPNWTINKPNFTETGGNYVGTPSVSRAETVATPAFAGCSTCTFATHVSMTGGFGAKVTLLAWYADKKNLVEVILDPNKNRVDLKQRVNRAVVASGHFTFTIDPNTTYLVEVSFSAGAFHVSVDGSTPFDVPAVGTPNGTVGFRVQRTVGSFADVSVN